MQQSIDPQSAQYGSEYQDLISAPQIERAFRFIDQAQEEGTEELIRICEIPAPPFKEGARAAYIKSRFEAIGLERVRTDAEGNVIAERRAFSNPSVYGLVHLDTSSLKAPTL